jgi:Asp-tRNA(Asn)/Glu-tRNA(Gln) amidotransferase A subunit family amidase
VADAKQPITRQTGDDVVALADEVGAGRARAHELVATALSCARARSELGAFWSLADDRALARATELDRTVEQGRGGGMALAGVPLAVKDGFDLAGLPTTGGMKGQHRSARSDAAAVRLLEAAGAVAIGKTAMDPLAWTTHGQAEGFPPCLNPVDPSLSPGGSSSGSAVAVAAGIVPLALGTDTAGSIRIPAAYCGVVGLKPGFGEVSLEGCLPLSGSCDTVGLLSTTVGGCAAAYDALQNSTQLSKLAAAGALPGRVGVLTDLFEASDPAVAAVCREPLHGVEAAGAPIEEVTLGWWAPQLGLLLAVEFGQAWGAEADADPSRFTADMLSTIERARTVSPERYQQVRAELRAARDQLKRRLRRFSALLSPTVPTPVPALEEEDVATSTRFTRIFSALGWPALSVPCGDDDRGRPVGMHVASAASLEGAVAAAALIERATVSV